MQMLRSMAGETIELGVDLAPDLDNIFADQGQVEQIIVNLIVNARDAMPDGGAITLRAVNADLAPRDVADWPQCEPGHYVLLSIQDTGGGMTQEVQARVFEPFFTTKERGAGTGLGLAIVAGIVRQCRGHILVSSQIGQGSTFSVYLPRAAQGAAPPARGGGLAPLVQGRGTVLVVEDDPAVRHLIETTLRNCGYQVRVALDGMEALRYSATFAEPLDLVLTDVVMPQMSGLKLGDHFRAKHPHTKVLYMTGYDDPAADSPLALQAEDVVLRKPFSPSLLATAVHRMLEDPADPRRA